MKQVIMASTSPRRKEILSKTKLTFTTEESDYEEDMSLDLPPNELAKTLSYGKAEAVAKRHDDAIIIGADTFIAFERKILGKPNTPEKAKEMLETLSGKSHSVFTGFTIIDCSNQKKVSKAIETKVYFKNLSDQEIQDYVDSGEPINRSGAYAIQELGALLVEKIEGDFFNVMGLPLSALSDTLLEFDVNCWKN
jgi:septum formation protein